MIERILWSYIFVTYHWIKWLVTTTVSFIQPLKFQWKRKKPDCVRHFRWVVSNTYIWWLWSTAFHTLGFAFTWNTVMHTYQQNIQCGLNVQNSRTSTVDNNIVLVTRLWSRLPVGIKMVSSFVKITCRSFWALSCSTCVEKGTRLGFTQLLLASDTTKDVLTDVLHVYCSSSADGRTML